AHGLFIGTVQGGHLRVVLVLELRFPCADRLSLCLLGFLGRSGERLLPSPRRRLFGGGNRLFHGAGLSLGSFLPGPHQLLSVVLAQRGFPSVPRRQGRLVLLEGLPQLLAACIELFLELLALRLVVVR